MNTFGLDADDRKAILSILAAHPEVESALVYGSRARGNFKQGSDIDMVLTGKNLTDQVLLDVCAEFRDSNVPYMVDIIAEHDIQDENLKREIEVTGQVFYRQTHNALPKFGRAKLNSAAESNGEEEFTEPEA